ncbi:hypothetical protein GGH99_008939, partial [Coemansia sp. RSA 1285]
PSMPSSSAAAKVANDSDGAPHGSALTSLGMVHPIHMNGTDADTSVAASSSSSSSSSSADAVAAIATSSDYLFGCQAMAATSPSLNDVASNLFSLRQQLGSQTNINSSSSIADGNDDDDDGTKGQLARINGGATIASHSGVPSVAADHQQQRRHQDSAVCSSVGRGDMDSQEQQQQQMRRGMAQSPFNVGVVSDNIQF